MKQATGLQPSEDQTIIIVSGLPRSGTSLMMRALEAAGRPLLTDGLRRPDEDNPRGYYEFERVKQIAADQSWLEQARGKAVKLIAQLLFHLPRGPRYKVVFMRRALHEVLASQKVMLQRRDHAGRVPDDEEMRRVLVCHLLEVEDRLRLRPDLETLFVSYNRMLADPLRQAERISRFLGGGLWASAMAGVVDPALYRQRGEATRPEAVR